MQSTADPRLGRRRPPALALVLLGALALAGAAAPSTGADDPPPEPEVDPEESKSVWDYLSKRYDADGDGKITFEEYGRSREHFDRLDADGDGVVSAADATARRRPSRGGKQRGEAGKRPQPPREGQRAPDFTLEVLERAPEEAKRSDPKDEESPLTVQLSDYAKAKKPVALIFGSYT
jgi:hypothetical protein